MNLVKVLSVVLSISLGANFFLFYFLYQNHSDHMHTSYGSPTDSSTQSSSNLTSKNGISHFLGSDSNARQSQLLSDKNVTAEAAHPSSLANGPQKDRDTQPEVNLDNLSEAEFFHRLQRLQANNAYEELSFEVSQFLRKYPKNIEALLIEADVYYHTQPLNIAIVHYKDLLNQPLSTEQRLDIEEIIAVNTTRVLQQFSGDGAWDLLAEFLEPLIQIDPLNRNYIISLARAYGMQSQLTLMENVLAALPSDDRRATQLRNAVMARLNQSQEPSQLSAVELDKNTASFDVRRAKQAVVKLYQNRGKFITTTKIKNKNLSMLVDTGASTTAISKSAFKGSVNQQWVFIGRFLVQTAGGAVDAPLYKIPELRVGSEKLQNISALVLSDDNLNEHDGLLGMNVLSQFDINIDANSQTMSLYKK